MSESTEASMSENTNNTGTPADQPGETAAQTAQPEAAQDMDTAGKLAALEAEVADLKDKLLRAVAETENVRKRAERDRTDIARYAAAGFARDMLLVSDNLRRAIAALKDDEREAASSSIKALIEGVEVTERQLLATLERHGIREITPAAGDRFDANLHEAMFEVPGTDQPAGTVVHVVEAGYTIGDRLLRAARVGVASGEAGAAPNSPPGSHIDTKA